MRIYKFENTELNVSEEIHKDILPEECFVDIFTELIQEDLLKPEHRQFLEAYGKKNNLSGYSILWAHGGCDKRTKWGYIDNEKLRSIQSWIDDKDGKYLALMLNCCNMNSEDIKSRKSLVLSPNKEFSPLSLGSHLVQIELYCPRLGYLDDYVIGFETEKLKR
jgi:hypothetical protein